MNFKETFTVKDFSNHVNINSTFITQNNKHITINSFINDVECLSLQLQQKYQSEQFVGIKLENSYEALLTIFALWNLGVCPVMLSPMMSKIEQLQLKNQVPFNQVISRFPIINKKQNKEISFRRLNISDNAVVIFTTGTKSIPKGVLLTFDNIIHSALTTIHFFNFQQNNKWVLSLPMNHIAGFMVPMRVLLGGGSVQLEDSNISTWSTISSNSFCSIVSTQLARALDNHKQSIIDNLKCFKLILIGGSAITTELLSFARKYQLNISPSYGMSEACSTIAAIPVNEFLSGNDNAATILPSFKIKITQNIINISSKCIAKGYFLNNKLNQEPFASKFFKTNDLGEVIKDNKLIVKGRTDNIIISGGKKISPTEIENEINLLPNIKNSFVIPFPDNTYGEIAVAFYTSNSNKYSPNKFRKILKDTIEPYKVPKLFIELPEYLRHQHKIPINEFHKLIIKYKAINES